MRNPIRLFAFCAPFAGLLALSPAARAADAKPPAPAKPNILLIYTDDVGYGDVGCYEGCKVKTPAIDRLAAEGLRFTDAHCPAATCTPSRFSMLTGTYPFRQRGTGIASGDAALIIHTDAPTLPKLLKQAGYATAAVGKWHLGLGKGHNNWNKEIRPNPNDIGFDYHFLLPATGDRVPCVYFEQGKVVDLDPADPIKVAYGKRIDPSPSGKEARDTLKMDYSHGHNQTIVNGISRIGWMTGGEKARWKDEEIAEKLASHAIAFIEKQAKAKKPFFVYYATHDIHVPRYPNRRFAGKSGLGPRGDAILEMDWQVAELLKTLDRLGIAKDTMVIFTSDNGPVLDDGYKDLANEKLGDHDPNGPWRAGKYSTFEGGTRVPFIVRWPARIPAGHTSNALFGHVDLAATFAALTGVKRPAKGLPDSRDELDTLLGTDKTGRPHLVEDFQGSGSSLRAGKWKFIPPGNVRDRLGPWKRVKIPKGGALYDIETDPGETTNLAGKFPKRTAEMRTMLKNLRANPDHS
jgi:arylsulfatase A-like enzyme